MSFGLAISDFIAVGDLALRLYKDVYKVSRSAPVEIKELAKELSVLSTSLQVLIEEAQNPQSVLVRSGESRVNMVKEVISNTKETLAKLEVYAKKHELLNNATTPRPLLQRTWDKLQYSKDASTINSLRSRISYHCGVINMLLTSVGNSSLERLHNENQGIARDTQEALNLLRTIMLDAQNASRSLATPSTVPVISASDSDMVNEELSREFLKNIETTDNCSWLETNIDKWLERGRNWCCVARFEVEKLRVLRDRPANSINCENVYKSALTALLKASWIIMNVIRDHPMRPYVTSGHRQLAITHLASDVTAELKALHALQESSGPTVWTQDISDFEIENRGEQLSLWHSRLSEKSFDSSWLRIDREPLPQMQYLVNLNSLRPEQKDHPSVVALARFETSSTAGELQVTVLGPFCAQANLTLYGPLAGFEWRYEPNFPQMTQTVSLVGRPLANIDISLNRDGCVPISSKGSSSSEMMSGVHIDVQLQGPIDEILPALRRYLSYSLRSLNRCLAFYLRHLLSMVEAQPRTAKALATARKNSELNPAECDETNVLIEVLARRFLLNDTMASIKKVYFRKRSPVEGGGYRYWDAISRYIEHVLKEADRVLREYRWWSDFLSDTEGTGSRWRDKNLTKMVAKWLQSWNLGRLDRKRLLPENMPIGELVYGYYL